MARRWVTTVLVVLVLGGATAPDARAQEESRLTIASFNIKWVGNSTRRDNMALARLLAPYDIVVVQEVVAPPHPGSYPNGAPFRPDPESRAFFDAMQDEGFRFVLSPSDTGPGPRIHTNASSTEWFVAFYKPEIICATEDPFEGAVCEAPDLPAGFIALTLAANRTFKRVPYAFGFRLPGGPDFVLVSVHLQPNAGPAARRTRRREIAGIMRWVARADERFAERDIIVLGDMNLATCSEIDAAVPEGWATLNACQDTTPARGLQPYDQVFFRPHLTPELDTDAGLEIIDLVDAVEPAWQGPGRFPGRPYDPNRFPQYYSDHHPVVFQIQIADDDD